jgi:hypothetical protein
MLLSSGPRSLWAAHWRLGVEPPHMCSPSSPTRSLSKKRSSVQWKRPAIPVNTCRAQQAPVVKPSFPFGRNLWPCFEFSPRACAGTEPVAVGNEGVCLSGEIVRVQQTVILLPDPCHVACVRCLSIHIQIVKCQVPLASCCACRQSE